MTSTHITNPWECREDTIWVSAWKATIGMEQIIWELRFSGEFWMATWVCSGEDMGSYKGYEIIDIRWNGWLVSMVIDFLQCLEGDLTLFCLSKLRPFRRWESRGVYACLCLFVCVLCVQWKCPFVGRECVCHTVPLILAECLQYVTFIMDYCPSWTLYMELD